MDASERHVKLHIRPSSVALWTGALAGPIAWAAALQSRYALVKYVCMNHAEWIMWAITIAALLVTGFGAWCSRRGWQLGDVETGFSPSGRAEARPHIKFMAIGGLFISGMFALAIIAMAIPDIFLRSCE